MIPKRIAVFASGRGSNALNIIAYFKDHPYIRVAFVLSNKADAPVVLAAQAKGIETVIAANEDIAAEGRLVEICESKAIDGIILAGFLRKIPSDFVARYENKILNIHPSLLPKYGGSGMYGNFVHQAVIDSKETESGITIHFVNPEYDKGEVVAQFSCPLTAEDNLVSVAQKIHLLEMEHFPKVIEQVFSQH